MEGKKIMHSILGRKNKIQFWRSLALVLCLLGVSGLAEARVGGGGSFGNRGSRSFSAPARPSSPAPGGVFGGNRENPSSSIARPYSPRPEEQFARSTPYSQSSPFGGGSFWRGVAGGFVGGMLGNILFRSLGYASYGSYGGGGWGGPGLFDLLLLGLLGYFAYRWISRRSIMAQEYAGGGWSSGRSTREWSANAPERFPAQDPVINLPPAQDRDLDRGIAQLCMLAPTFARQRFCDQAMDSFFRLQAAWSARDLSPLHALFTDEVAVKLQNDIDRFKREQVINHVENIAVRTCELSEAWQEAGQDFVTVYFYANCLDYDVNETTGEVVRGSKIEPTKFEEFWTFTRPAGDGTWKLSAITQA
jgi:predicted lipid-binding transport protein (Tim44 family)